MTKNQRLGGKKPIVPRPPKLPEYRKDFTMRVRLTTDQHRILKRAAERAGEDVSTWVRIIAMTEARAILGLDQLPTDSPTPTKKR